MSAVQNICNLTLLQDDVLRKDKAAQGLAMLLCLAGLLPDDASTSVCSRDCTSTHVLRDPACLSLSACHHTLAEGDPPHLCLCE